MQHNTIPPDPTTARERDALLRGPHAHRIRPAPNAVGTFAEMMRYALGDTEWPDWRRPDPLQAGFRRRFIQAMIDDPDFAAAIGRLAG